MMITQEPQVNLILMGEQQREVDVPVIAHLRRFDVSQQTITGRALGLVRFPQDCR